MKKYRRKDLRDDFILTLQFYDADDGAQDMLVTVNKGRLRRFDMFLHGLQLYECEFLDKEDKKAIATFCRAFLEEMKRKEGK